MQFVLKEDKKVSVGLNKSHDGVNICLTMNGHNQILGKLKDGKLILFQLSREAAEAMGIKTDEDNYIEIEYSK